MTALTINEVKVNFNPSLKIGLSHEKITSDGGLVLYKEAAHMIGFFERLQHMVSIQDNRNFYTHSYTSVLEQLVFQHLAGYCNRSNYLSVDQKAIGIRTGIGYSNEVVGIRLGEK